MSSRFLLFLFLVCIFISCDKEDNIVVDDIKAAKMEQIGGLFENAARQPEYVDELIKSSEIMLYSSIEDLLPISDKNIELRGKARGYAFGKMFESLARQPEALTHLDAIAKQFLGEYDSDIISKELREYTVIYSAEFILQGIARQPEILSVYNGLTKKYLDCDLDEISSND